MELLQCSSGRLVRACIKLLSCLGLFLVGDVCSAMEGTEVTGACPQMPNERISNLSREEFLRTFGDDVRGQRLEVTPLGAGINRFRLERAGPRDFLLRRSLTVRSDRRAPYSEPNYIVTLNSQSSAHPTDTQYGLDVVHAYEARSEYEREYGRLDLGKVVVAVIDSGIDTEHPALQNSLWELDTAVTLDGGSQCQVGAVGYNAITSVCGKEAVKDTLGHGTHVAGIIAANGPDLRGVVPGARILVIKAFGADGKGDISSVVRALKFVERINGHRPRIRIINNSWGYTGESAVASCRSEALSDALDSLANNSVLLVASADNWERNLDSPGSAPYYLTAFANNELLTVGASGFGDTVGGSYGSMSVDMRAPGYEILSTWPLPAGSRHEGGTSMAAAFVSGAAAFLWSACPGLNPDQVKTVLMNSAQCINEHGFNTLSGRRLDVLNALHLCRNPSLGPVPAC